MTPDLLYRVQDIPLAFATVLDVELPAGVATHAALLPVNVTAPYVLLTVRTPHPDGPPMAGDQTMEATLSATSVGVNRDNTDQLGDLVRQAIVGRDGSGGFATAFPLDDRAVLHRDCNYDGAPDLVGGVPQWTETYQILIGRAGA